jgi:hypothetical protein
MKFLTPNLSKAIALSVISIACACVAICLRDVYAMAVPCVVALFIWSD